MEQNSNTPRRGAWTVEEDDRLRACIQQHGEGQWHLVPTRAGLNRCRKSCRMRWMNYLKPDIKRGDFEEDEIDLILRMHKLLGNRWALIAHRLPGRTANDIKNYWNRRLKKTFLSLKEVATTETIKRTIFKPRPHTLSANYCYNPGNIQLGNNMGESSSSQCDKLMDDNNGDGPKLCDNGTLEENVAQHIETNADDIDDDAQLINPWSDLCPDDVDLSDLYEVLHGNHPLI